MKHDMPASNTIIGVVNSYLKTRALAEMLRKKVDDIKRAALTECPLYDKDGNKITDIRFDYQADDLEGGEMQAYYDAIDKRARAAGIKPDSMSVEYCPALVAEDGVRKIEHLIIEASRDEFTKGGPDLSKITVNGLLCLGLEKYKEFIDLVVGFAVNAPNFKKEADK